MYWRVAPCLLVLCVLAVLDGLGADGAAADAGAAPGQTLEYTLILTGDELLQGRVQDAHTAFLARTLLPLGAVCVGAQLVDDLDADLRAALGTAVRRAPLVLVTGGLGPTQNDITRDTLSGFTGIPLQEDAGLVQDLARRLGVTPERLPQNLRRQTRVPGRGGFLRNGQGTAVGLVFEGRPAVVVALPGPPRELQPMVRDELVPWLERRFGLRKPGSLLTLRFVGLGQSRIDQVLQEKVTLPEGAVVGSVFEGGRVDFTFALARDDEAARAALRRLEEAIRAVLGDHVYAAGSQTLEAASLSRVRESGGTIALAEVGTGGALAAALSRDPATRGLVAGSFAAPASERLRTLLQVAGGDWAGAADARERQRLSAIAARARAGASWGLAVGEPGGESHGVSQVPVAAVGPEGWCRTTELELRDSAESGRANLMNAVLDWFRRL